MPDPVFAQFGSLTIRWYGITAAFGFAAGFWYIKKVSPLFLNRDSIKHVEKLLVPLVIAGLIGARLYHVLNELPFYLEHPALIPAVWHGGLAIHGGVIAGALYLWRSARKQRMSFLALADILMPALLLGQAIGRWGNFFNQELFGAPTALPWGILIDALNRPSGFEQFTHFHPAFLYESLWNMLVVIGITAWSKRHPQQKPGVVLGIALAFSGMGRFLVELLRVDTVPLVLGIRLPLLVSAAIAILGTGIFFYAKKLIDSNDSA